MARFDFKAIDARGRIITGASEAPSLDGLKHILSSQGLFLMEGRPAGSASVLAPSVSVPAEEPARHARSGDAVPLETVAIFTTQLAIMVRTALPILESLGMLSRQQTDPVMKSILQEVAQSVREGKPLSASFLRYPKVFDQVYVSLVAAGEAGGNMPMMLDRLSSYLTFQIQLKEKVRSALLYPLIVSLTVVAVAAFLVLFILPTFMQVFSEFNIELPLATRILVNLSEAVRRLWIVLLGAGAAAWWYFSRLLSDPTHTRSLRALELRVPFIGTLVRNVVMTRVLRTLGALVASGVPILKSLELARASAGNVIFQDLLDRVYRSATEGRGLSSALAESPYIPESVIGMIATGEKTGALPEVINKVADFYESETDTAIKDLFTAVEPLFVVALGLLVGGIAVSILLPMFNLAQGLE